jgi:arylsulfatase A-like enzyme
VELDRSLLLALPFLAFACSEEAPPAQKAAPAEQPASAVPVKAAKVEEKAEPKKPTRSTEPLNVILITVDALRADMPWAGYARDIAPNLTKFAKANVIFENHRSTTSFTAQSLPAMLAGRMASTLYRSGYFFAGYSDANEFFPEALQQKGIATVAVQAHMYFDRGKGLNQGFDRWEMVPGITYNERTDEHVTSEKSTALMQKLLSDSKVGGKQFFAWAHYTDPHADYQKHSECPDFGNGSRDKYDNEVCYTDLHIGKLLAWAEKQPFWDRTAVIISADHGEAFGEHGLVEHARELYEEVVRVPMIARIPGVESKRITTAHTHLDLAPTILELMGQEPLAGFEGRSMLPEIDGKPGKERFLVLELAADNIQPARRAVVSGDYKLIRFGEKSGAPEKLFDLASDPGEKKDLAKTQPDKLKEMSALLDSSFEKLPIVEPFGGMKLKGGGEANGPKGPTVAKL